MASVVDAVKTRAVAATDALVPPMMVQFAHVQHDDLTPAEIEPSWVLEGSPRARVKHIAHASDDELAIALWDCTAGRFDWHFGGDEFVHILAGEVTVTDGDGTTRKLKPGDTAYFPAGMNSVWHVHEYVKKLAVFRQNRPPLAVRARRKIGALVRIALTGRPQRS